MTRDDSILEPLNPAQRVAVTHPGGPLLIVAGPGSGKTRVIAHRIAWLVRCRDVWPSRILAVTFTNKAAAEMRERAEALVGPEIASAWMGTFHRIAVRILRVDGPAIGVPQHFAIYDDADQQSLMKQVLTDLLGGDGAKRFPPRSVLASVSRWKNETLSPADAATKASTYPEELAARAYARYQQRLREAHALDFDDLLLEALRLLRDVPEIRLRYAERFRHVLVDEYQDTNLVQYEIARLLASVHGNITAVGDPDQSIYSWRSADVRIILNFERDFPGATVVLLEQNYRSTQTVLDAAESVIRASESHRARHLWTDRGAGIPVTLYEALDEVNEAEFVVRQVQSLTAAGRRYGEVAVMYRTNGQSRPLEEAFVLHRMPYRLVGGLRFYERREVKDLMAYLRLLVNPFDSVAFLRVLNVPPRGIGQKTADALTRWSASMNLPAYAALQALAAGEAPPPAGLAKRALDALLAFHGLLNSLVEATRASSAAHTLDTVVEATGYRAHLAAEGDEAFEERWENVQQLRSAAEQYDEREDERGLAGFLEELALVADVDTYDSRADAVTLITLHAAKGLEFPVVFIVGFEEGVLPHVRSFDSREALDEERRLCFVGMTRTKDLLFLTTAYGRSAFGSTAHNPPSRFLRDIPAELLRYHGRDAASPTAAARWGIRLPPPLREPEPARPRAEFAAGQHVRHAKFGEGVVVSTRHVSGDTEVTVAFVGEAGVKRLLASFAPLEAVLR